MVRGGRSRTVSTSVGRGSGTPSTTGICICKHKTLYIIVHIKFTRSNVHTILQGLPPRPRPSSQRQVIFYIVVYLKFIISNVYEILQGMPPRPRYLRLLPHHKVNICFNRLVCLVSCNLYNKSVLNCFQQRWRASIQQLRRGLSYQDDNHAGSQGKVHHLSVTVFVI